jgi:hypothetical protein
MKQVPLVSRKYHGRYAIVDDEDFDRVAKFKWNIVVPSKRNKTSYAIRFEIDAATGKRRKVWMHREVMGADKAVDVDHRDGNGLNNQKENLRPCSHVQNMQNAKKWMKGSSRFKGVFFNKTTGYFVARIAHKGTNHNLGVFRDENSAGLAYNEGARRLFGEFARLNEIPSTNRRAVPQLCFLLNRFPKARYAIMETPQ